MKKAHEYIDELDISYDQRKLLKSFFVPQAELSDPIMQVLNGAMRAAEVKPFSAKKARLVFNAEMRDNGYTWKDRSFLEKPSDYLSRSGKETLGQIDQLINKMKA